MALPSTGRAGVGNRVCTGTGLGPWCSGGGSSVHTRPMGENGSSCADLPVVPSEFLYLPLSLAVCLGMVTGGQAHRDS